MKDKRPKGVPDTARLAMLYNALDFIKTANALLKPHGLRIRTKASQRGGGVPSWVWVEEIKITNVIEDHT